jgi:uncharacterized protein involved in type VI secretion and phage assembly
MTHTPVRPDGPLLSGLYPATVTALEGDPLGLQRVQVSLDWLPAADGGGGAPRAWAVLVSPYADADQGVQLLPGIGSTVVVGFLAGHADHPYLIGGTWNGRAGMPEKPTDANDLRVVQSRSGSRLEFDDTPGAVAVRLSAAGPAGSPVHTLVLDDAARTVTVHSASGATVTLTAAGGVTVEAAATVEITAAALTVNAAMSQFNGVVTCQTLIATGGGVVSPAYTPGAGNVW